LESFQAASYSFECVDQLKISPKGEKKLREIKKKEGVSEREREGKII